MTYAHQVEINNYRVHLWRWDVEKCNQSYYMKWLNLWQASELRDFWLPPFCARVTVESIHNYCQPQKLSRKPSRIISADALIYLFWLLRKMCRFFPNTWMFKESRLCHSIDEPQFGGREWISGTFVWDTTTKYPGICISWYLDVFLYWFLDIRILISYS